MTQKKENKKSSFDESLILKSLSKQNVKKVTQKPVIQKKICRAVKIISKYYLEIRKLDYFKFPFNPDITNDESKTFNLIYEEWTVALTDVYRRFGSIGQEFYISFFGSTIIFGKNILCTNELQETLEKQNILFNKTGNLIEVPQTECAGLFDYILNIDVQQFNKLPFILSKDKFLNSLTYSTKVSEMKRVQYKDDIKWYYLIDGYLFAPDFSIYSEHELIFEFV